VVELPASCYCHLGVFLSQRDIAQTLALKVCVSLVRHYSKYDATHKRLCCSWRWFQPMLHVFAEPVVRLH